MGATSKHIALLLVVASLTACKSRPRATPVVGDSVKPVVVTDAMLARWQPVAEPTSLPRFVWWEAEAPVDTNFGSADAHPFAPANAEEADGLSGGSWIGADQPKGVRFAIYDVAVEHAATYDLYVRKFWKHGPFHWRFDDGSATPVTADAALLDAVELRQFVVANWVHAGQVNLDAGSHRFRVDVDAGARAAAFDAFVLVEGPFRARGKLRPDQSPASAPDGAFVFDPPPDRFAPTPLDLIHLNEPIAADASVLMARDGGLWRADGTRERLWGVNAGCDVLDANPRQLRHYARWLAKRGVNAVRIQCPVWRDDDPRKRPDQERVATVQRAVASFAEHGIYTALSIFFPLATRLDAATGVGGYAGQPALGAVYFDASLERLYRDWWRALLTAPNPHRGVALARDPALVHVELVNEDSTLFWTFNAQTLPASQWSMVERRFAAWLVDRHGDLEVVRRRWASDGDVPDRFSAQGIELLSHWALFNDKTTRSHDQAQFLAESMRRFYTRMVDHLRDDLGYRGNVVCSNWITASAEVLGPLERWANAPCSIVDRHGYHDPLHDGPDASWSLQSGQRYQSSSALTFERRDRERPDHVSRVFGHPIVDVAYGDAPTLLSEVGAPAPNRWRAEMPLVAAAYASLQDIDGVLFHAAERLGWDHRVSKFSYQTPLGLGQSPAAAWLYRRGLVQTADVIVRVGLSASDMFSLAGSPISPAATLDQLRVADIDPSHGIPATAAGRIDPLASLVGRVHVDLAADVSSSHVDALERFIDHDAHVVTSRTGELRWDYGRGQVIIDASRAQAVAGFLDRHPAVETAAVRFEMGMSYGAAIVVALDDRPLRTSTRLLLQVASEEINAGWRETEGEDGLVYIDDVGGPPLHVRAMAGIVRLQRDDLATLQATALDVNGQPTHRLVDLTAGIPLLADVLYYVIEPAAVSGFAGANIQR